MAAEVKSIIAEGSDAGISALIGREYNDPKSSLIDEILKHFYTACGVADDGGIIKDKKKPGIYHFKRSQYVKRKQRIKKKSIKPPCSRA